MPSKKPSKKKKAAKKTLAPKSQGKRGWAKDLTLEDVRSLIRSEQLAMIAEEITKLHTQIETLQRRLTAVEIATTRIPRSYPYPQPQEPQQPSQPTWPVPSPGPWSPTWQPTIPPWNGKGNDNAYRS